MHFDASAPAPPTAQKYTEPLRTIALQTSSERGPLPIIAPRPISKSFGEKTSILLEVVGPQLPIANEFDCAASSVRVVANPAGEFALSGLLKKSVRHCVHEQTALSYAVATVNGAKANILE